MLQNTLRRLRDPRRRVQEARLRLDDGELRLQRAWGNYIGKKQESLGRILMRLRRIHLRSALQVWHHRLKQLHYMLYHNIQYTLSIKRAKNRELTLRLKALNPANVLQRGYSITREIPSKRIVKTSKPIKIHQQVEVQLASGALLCRVEGKYHHGKENV
jgi:exodeoxyribonuclease VII large subunit